jgi:hypothetical protein
MDVFTIWSIELLFTQLSIAAGLAILIRFVASKLLKKVWGIKVVRLGFDTSLLLLVALSSNICLSDLAVLGYITFLFQPTVVITAFALAFLMRFGASKLFKKICSVRFIRIGFDVGLLTVAALFSETILSSHVDAETQLYWQHIHAVKFSLPCQTWYDCLLSDKHFIDLFPIVVLLPAFIIGLVVYSFDQSRQFKRQIV